MDLEEAWNFVENLLQAKESLNLAGLKMAVEKLVADDLLDAVYETLSYQIEQSIVNSVLPYIFQDANCTLPILVTKIYNQAKSHRDAVQPLILLLDSLKCRHELAEAVQRTYRIEIEFSHQHKITELAEEFYSKAYLVCSKEMTSAEDLEESNCCPCELSPCQCHLILLQMSAITENIQELGLFQNIIEDVLFGIARAKIKERVSTTCASSYSKTLINDLTEWLNNDLIGWLDKVTVNLDGSEILSKERLMYYLYDSFVKLRLDEILPMIIDYPDSRPSFEDLHSVLPQTNLRKQLIVTIKQVYESRILHPGVTTTDILTAYIQSIQAFRVLDPSCVILEIVTEPVKLYLRSREDTVRCIVANLIDESCEVLSDELTKGTSDQDTVDEDNIGEGWQHWLPDPVDANPDVSSKARRSTDIINMLVNIYGTKELFIKEYWNLLADRLLSNLSYTTMWEIRYFELLKIRFGETDLLKCEVMLKDVTDSKRLNTWINEELQKTNNELPMNALMLSAQYWPTFREEPIELPAEMKDALTSYTKAYETTKVNRTLKWQPHIGQVEVDIEMDSGNTVTFKTSPVNVAIIMAFQEQGMYTVEELAEKLQTSASVIRRRISYWQSHGVLKEISHDVYELNKDSSTSMIHEPIEEEVLESATASSEQQKEQEFQVMWSYINGMLTNSDSLPLERIHSMLKIFANAECTVHELERFLSKKIREGKVVCAAGVYKLAS